MEGGKDNREPDSTLEDSALATRCPIRIFFGIRNSHLVADFFGRCIFWENPEYRTTLEVYSISQRVLQFRVIWEDVECRLRVSQYQVQFNSPLDPWV
ncbi:uncharacterized protein TrAFT101_000319 [Trichoderma asperellum]|uniref:uncharacterized protein n=1 Tax=Trichoderma asperellum TaxID=101201 RepID=UPI00331E8939|nr:hypothetical protein TrAFT101_000319 [Trichoderma asperellum]